MLEVKEVLEKGIAKLAVRRGIHSDLQNIQEITDRISQAAGKNENISDVTVELYRALAESTHKCAFVQLMGRIIPLIVSKGKGISLSPKEKLRMHIGVEDYLHKGDEGSMVKWIEEHLAYMRKKFLEYYRGTGKIGLGRQNLLAKIWGLWVGV